MEKAMSRDPQVLHMYDSLEGKYALHFAAESFAPNAVDAVRWLLKKGIPWSVKDGEDNLPEALAKVYENEESWMVLRNWAIEFGAVISYRCSQLHAYPSTQNMSYITGQTWRTIQTIKHLSGAFCAWIGKDAIKTSATRPLSTSTQLQMRWHSSHPVQPEL